ncbi:ricin-type beta-trefoil lectin domain protein [Kitasatospora sp. NPDC059571]|uniref:RICIN domain-containing protein n=1 Tax=Kitasatospora sp. NPDC059571 TaxID=3346871 RepID=UPI0036A8A8EF
MKLRALGSATAALALALGLAVAGTGTATAESQTTNWTNGHVYRFISLSPDYYHASTCLDDSGTSPSGFLRNWTCNGQDYQQWKVIALSNGWAQLKNVHTGRCLDYSHAYHLRTYVCNGPSFTGGWQGWAMINRTVSGQSQQVLKSATNEDPTSMCVDISSGGGTRGYACNGASQDAGYQSFWAMDESV